MKTFFVQIPLAGRFSGNIEAENEKEAINKMKEKICNINDYTRNELNDNELEMKWDLYDKLVEGNICHVYDNETYAEEVE